MEENRSAPEHIVSVVGNGDKVGELFRRILDDLRAIAKDEVALARVEIKQSAKAAGMDAGAVILGGVVALVGFAMLCTTVVIALAPLIPALWLRMLLMSILYLAVGGAIAGVFIQRLKHDAPPLPNRAAGEARATARAVKREVQHA